MIGVYVFCDFAFFRLFLFLMVCFDGLFFWFFMEVGWREKEILSGS